MDWSGTAAALCAGRDGAWTREAHVDLGGHPCAIRYTPGEDAADFVFEVRVPDPPFDRVVVRSASLLRFVPRAGRRAWESTGDVAFDAAILIEAPWRPALDRWLEEGARTAIETLQTALGEGTLRITLDGRRARVACRCGIDGPEAMRRLLVAAEAVAQTALRSLGARSGARSGTDRVEAVLAWLDGAVRELHRADASYADAGWNIGENEQYLRIKRVGFGVLLDELKGAAREGAPGLLRVLGSFAFHPVLAEDFGESAFATADAKLTRVLEALTRFLTDGEPLPDAVRTI